MLIYIIMMSSLIWNVTQQKECASGVIANTFNIFVIFNAMNELMIDVFSLPVVVERIFLVLCMFT